MHSVVPRSTDPERDARPEPGRMKPIVSDREFIIVMGFMALFGLFGAAVVVVIFVGFWLTASNRWAANSAFLFATALITLVCTGGCLFAWVRTFLYPGRRRVNNRSNTRRIESEG